MKGFSQTMITKGGFESLEEERNSCGLNISLTSEPEMSMNKNSIKLRKDFLICPLLSMKNSNEWEEKSNCFICTIIFDKLKGIFRHHCRICGKSVCSLCSSKMINEQRSCDLCFLRIDNEEMIERKEKVLALKDDYIEEAEEKISLLLEEIKKIETNTEEFKKEAKKVEKFQNSDLNSKKKELIELKNKIEKNQEKFNSAKEKENLILIKKNERNDELIKLTKKKNEIKTEKERNNMIKLSKFHELENLIKQISKTKATKSFANIFEYLELDSDEILRTFSTIDQSIRESMDNKEFSSKVKRTLRKSLKASKSSLMKPQTKMSFAKTTFTKEINSLKKEKICFGGCFSLD